MFSQREAYDASFEIVGASGKNVRAQYSFGACFDVIDDLAVGNFHNYGSCGAVVVNDAYGKGFVVLSDRKSIYRRFLVLSEYGAVGGVDASEVACAEACANEASVRPGSS